MGYFDSLFDSDLKALKKALKLIDDAENRLKRKDGSGVASDLNKARDIIYENVPRTQKHVNEYSDALVTLSNSYVNCSMPEEANRAADKALSITPDSVNAYIGKSHALGAIRSHKEAIAILDKAISLNPNNKMLWSEKGRSLDSSGDSAAAVECYKKILEIDSADIHYYDVLIEKAPDKSVWIRKKDAHGPGEIGRCAQDVR